MKTNIQLFKTCVYIELEPETLEDAAKLIYIGQRTRELEAHSSMTQITGSIRMEFAGKPGTVGGIVKKNFKKE